MDSSDPAPASSKSRELSLQMIMLPVLFIGAGTAILYFAAPILIPLVMAISLAYVMLPFVDFLKRLKIPHALAVFIVTFVILGLFGLLAFLLIAQVADFISVLPQYKDQIFEKIQSLNSSIGEFLGQFQGLFKGAEDLKVDAENVKSLGQFLLKGVSSLTNFLVGLISLFFLVLFMLLESNLFAGKFKRIFGHEHSGTTEKILDEINRQMKAYIQVRFYDFLGVSLVTMIGLLILDVQYAYIWGPLAGILNIIPYIGSFAGAIPPIIVAGIQHNSIMPMVYVAVFFIILQMIEGNYIMPKLTTSSVDLNAVTVLVSLMYWGWIWGGIGLILSVPITAAIKVVCDNVEPLKPIGLLMGTDRSVPQRPEPAPETDSTPQEENQVS